VFNEASVARLHTHYDAQVYGFGHFILRHSIADNMLDLGSRLTTNRPLGRVPPAPDHVGAPRRPAIPARSDAGAPGPAGTTAPPRR
jgi:hypothetical protein